VSCGFWTGGHAAYEEWLLAEYQRRRRELCDARQTATSPDDMRRMEAELAALKAEYRRRQGPMGRLLF